MNIEEQLANLVTLLETAAQLNNEEYLRDRDFEQDRQNNVENTFLVRPVGRPRVALTREQIEFYHDMGFIWSAMCFELATSRASRQLNLKNLSPTLSKVYIF